MAAAMRGQSAYTVGVDATRIRSGGGVAHIVGLFAHGDPRTHGVGHVHLWAHDKLLEAVVDRPWIEKHAVPATRGSIARQLAWQRFSLPGMARRLGVEAIFNADAGSICPFRPSATMSQDMLSFEPGEIDRYPWPSRARIRLEILRFVQLRRLRRSDLAIFLSQHARDVIGRLARPKAATVIAHGIDPAFREASKRRRPWPATGPVRCLYVSNAAPYKHQWHVVEAVSLLRARSGRDLRLRLVGGGRGPAAERLLQAVAKHDPQGRFVETENFIPNAEIPGELASADLFVYASSCENLPITLLEAMAAGLPIAASNRGPMPEVLGDGATWFDPEKPATIADALERLIDDKALRSRCTAESTRRAEGFTWDRCADSTWRALAEIAEMRRG